MIRHVVSWKLAAEDEAGRADAVAQISSLLGALPAVSPGILSLTVGTNMAYFENNWDVVLVADYEDLAALDAYQVHPDHLAAVTVIRTLVTARAAVDFEV